MAVGYISQRAQLLIWLDELEWPSGDVLFRCVLLALVTQTFDEAMASSQEGEVPLEDLGSVYTKARGRINLKVVQHLLRELYDCLGDKKRFPGMDSIAPLTDEEEGDLQRLVVEKLHNSLTPLELSVFLTCYYITGVEYYPQHICG